MNRSLLGRRIVAAPPLRRRGWRPSLWILPLALAALGGGCQSVDFTEKEALGSRLMALDEDPSEVNFQHKSTDSREGSVGARGGSTGGGCGCY